MTEKLFQHPGWLKVLSVVLAVMLWAYVRPNYTEETTKIFSDVPLTVLPHPAYELYDQENLPETVQIRAEGTGSVLNRLEKDDLKAVLDLSHVSEPGRVTSVPIQVEGPERVSYVVFPRSIQVVLVQQGSQMFPVTVEPATGTILVDGKEYRYSATADVTEASVGGRSDYLGQVQRVQVRLDTAELSPTTTTLTKAGTPLDAAGNELPGLTQPQVTVRLVWEELPPARYFTVEPVTVGSLPPGVILASIQADPATVHVRAQQVGAALPNRLVIQTEPIDLTGRTQSFSTTVALVAPEGTNPAVDSVVVRVTLKEEVVERIFEGVPVTVVGVPAEGVAGVTPESVTIRVKGPYSVLAGLDAASVHAEVDVGGLTYGTQTLPIKVTAPAGAMETAVDPAVVVATVVSPEPSE